MVSKYIIGALLLGATSAIELKKEHNDKFTWPIEGKVNAYKQEKHEKDAAFKLDEALKSHYCTVKADHMCTMKSGEKHYLFCVKEDLGKHAIKTAEGTYGEFKGDNDFKFFDTDVKEFEEFECKKQEKPLSEEEVDVLLAIETGKLGEKDEKKAKDEKNTLCVSMTPKTKEAAKKEADNKDDKKDDKKEKTEEPKKEVLYFQVEKAKDQKFTFELKNESLKALYENIICNTDEEVKKAAEKFLAKESESKCSGWWWLLVIPVVGGIGAGAYYALKEEDDEAEVDEYDAEYQA